MKLPFHVYINKLEEIAKAALDDVDGLWSSPRAPINNRRTIFVDREGFQGVIAEFVRPAAMRHIVESQPRVIIALIGVIRVLAEHCADYELRLGALGEGPISPALPSEIEVSHEG